jgi:hypothetical protein
MQSLPQLLDSVRIRERGPVARYTGIVVDDFHEPVAGAEVIAAGAADLGVRTDSAGHFRLLKAQKGTLVLRVRKFGYTPYFGSLSLRAEREDTRKASPTGTAGSASRRKRIGYTFAIRLDSRMRQTLVRRRSVAADSINGRTWTLPGARAHAAVADHAPNGCSAPRCDHWTPAAAASPTPQGGGGRRSVSPKDWSGTPPHGARLVFSWKCPA